MNSQATKRGIQEMSEESPVQAETADQEASASPLLPNAVLRKIVLFSPKHLRLRLVSSSWNNSVIDAHRNPDCGCNNCACKASLGQFTSKRSALPWISKWSFEKHQYGSQVSSSSACGSFGNVPITNVTVEVDDACFNDFVDVMSSDDMQQVKTLRIEGSYDLTVKNCRRLPEALEKLKQVEHFDFCFWSFQYLHGKDDFHRIVSSLPNLNTLNLHCCALDDSCLPVFASSPFVSGLLSLSLTYNPRKLTAFGIHDSLCASPYLTKLAHLDLSNSKCGDGFVVVICQSRTLTSIKTLALSDCDLRDESIEAIVSSPLTRNLTRLDINNNRISATGFTSLFASACRADSPFSRLRSLNCHQIGSIPGHHLMREVAHEFSPSHKSDMPQREANLELTIGCARTFDRKAVEALTNIPFMKFVRTLQLYSSDEDAASIILSPSSQFSSLQDLDLVALSIPWFSLKSLLSSPLANNLRTLKLGSHSGYYVDNRHGDDELRKHLDDDCCAVIADAKTLQNLQSLSIGQTHMSASRGLIRLLSSPNLPSLKHLDCNFKFDYEKIGQIYPREVLGHDDVARLIVQHLLSTAVGVTYFRFPYIEYVRYVKEKVEKNLVRLMTLDE